MPERVKIVAILSSVSLLFIVIELVRRKRLKEEYSLLWLLTTVALFILSFWRGLLDVLARLMGIFYPPTALFVVGFGFLLLILLHFSTVISKLSTENRVLTQRLGILSWQVKQLEKTLLKATGAITPGQVGRPKPEEEANERALGSDSKLLEESNPTQQDDGRGL